MQVSAVNGLHGTLAAGRTDNAIPVTAGCFTSDA